MCRCARRPTVSVLRLSLVFCFIINAQICLRRSMWRFLPEKQRIHDSESARAAAQSATSLSSAAASIFADAADSNAKYDALWQKFAEKVMQHLVWPAMWAGHITAAPKECIDNPRWWVDGITPILGHEDVYSLYYKGGKKKANGCWGHVC